MSLDNSIEVDMTPEEGLEYLKTLMDEAQAIMMVLVDEKKTPPLVVARWYAGDFTRTMRTDLMLTNGLSGAAEKMAKEGIEIWDEVHQQVSQERLRVQEDPKVR